MLPLVVIAFALFGGLMRYYTIKELGAYSRAGSISGEVLTVIRTVVAFGGEKKELHRYARELDAAEKVGIKKSAAVGGALIFWYGIKLIREEAYDAGSVLLVFMNVIMGSIYLGSALPNFQYFMNAVASAREIYGTIERKPAIDKDNRGVQLPDFKGNVTFQNVSFSYPTRPDIPVLKNFNLNLESGKSVALVGPSGSGKSTIVHLLQRFYDATEGQAYDTLIGERGSGLSGGQKQRIAIARALIRKPKLLLLDEATSALDTKSERVVQKALEKASSERTAVIVAHRLTTIRNADLILVLNKGVIRESGTHNELIAQNGLYAAMLRNQKETDQSTKEDEEYDDGPSEETSGFGFHPESVWQGDNEVEGNIFIFEIFPIILTNPSEADRRTSLVCGMMALLGFIRFFSMLAQGYFFGVSGERLTKRLRALYFECILKQEIGWFDQPENQAGALTASLATQATQLKLISGSHLGIMMEAIVLAAVSLIIGFIYSWQLTLLFLGLFPLMVISGMFQFRNMAGKEKHKDDTTMMRVAQEAINNDRTVFTLNLEEHFYEKFHRVMQNERKAVLRECLLFGLTYALTQSLALFAFAAVFALGIHLIERKIIDVLAVFRVFSVMNMGAQSLGRTASFGPEAKRASESARTIFATIDRQSQIPADEGVTSFELNWFV
ncbi:hypothetical protein PHET_06290 [Paragonimus heterotremus]|uniref:Uncharacterized protein n=1 Tax=Paragonimus heterotremus TaxID=100268 RepID=A0A8J4TDV3_9TREM|nr:hypothetical protein PHET_06290 [Paragonimus heterotremus]